MDKGLFLKDQLRVTPSTPVTSDAGIRIFQLYLPVRAQPRSSWHHSDPTHLPPQQLYFWLRCLVLRGRQRPSPSLSSSSSSSLPSTRPLVIGIHAPQGAGKTTLVNFCQALFQLDGLSSVVLSIDDFYLTNQEQQAVAAMHPNNRLLQFRGSAGTHDVPLGRETILQCLHARPGDAVPLPSYDKSSCNGRGDRAPREAWPVVKAPIDVVLLEGWMLGFRPLPPDHAALKADPGLPEVNAQLGAYAQWHDLVDAWVVVQVEDVDVIYSWRLEAEQRMREQKGAAGSMTDEQVQDFVSRFLPSYRAYLQPFLYAKDALPPDKPALRFFVDAQRKPKA